MAKEWKCSWEKVAADVFNRKKEVKVFRLTWKIIDVFRLKYTDALNDMQVWNISHVDVDIISI